MRARVCVCDSLKLENFLMIEQHVSEMIEREREKIKENVLKFFFV